MRTFLSALIFRVSEFYPETLNFLKFFLSWISQTIQQTLLKLIIAIALLLLNSLGFVAIVLAIPFFSIIKMYRLYILKRIIKKLDE